MVLEFSERDLLQNKRNSSVLDARQENNTSRNARRFLENQDIFALLASLIDVEDSNSPLKNMQSLKENTSRNFHSNPADGVRFQRERDAKDTIAAPLVLLELEKQNPSVTGSRLDAQLQRDLAFVFPTLSNTLVCSTISQLEDVVFKPNTLSRETLHF